nr:hypothetical protein [Tanacetum cinerariifolium]
MFIMDDPNITIKEYIRLKKEKARRQGQTFDWKTARYDKREYYENKDDGFMNLETEYPAIVFDDISDATFSREPTIKNENDKINILSSPSPEPTIGYFDDLDFFKDFENEFPAIIYNDLKSKSDPLSEPSVDGYDEGIVHSYEQRLNTIWGRPVNRVHLLDFAGLSDGMRHTLRDRLSMVYAGDDMEVLFTSHAWMRLFEVK